MGLITKLFGTRSEREVKKLMPLVEKIEALGKDMKALSDEELRGKTAEFQRRYQNGETLDELLPEGHMFDEGMLPNNPLSVGRYNTVYFDQLMWYWNTSCQMEAACGQKIPGLLCMHIAPHEFSMAAANPDKCVKSGCFDEPLDPGVLNSGLFSTILQRGDIRTISCAHTHMNDFDATYCGIRLCWDACAGYRCYGTDALRGGRLFEIREDDPWHLTTRMIHTWDAIKQ